MFEVTLSDPSVLQGERTVTFSPDRNDKDQEIWGIEDPPGWVHVMADGVVHYFPTWRVLEIRTSVRPPVVEDEEVSAD